MPRLILLCLTATSLTGCAAAGLLSQSSSLLLPAASAADIHSQTVVKLEQPNFRLVQANVSGRSAGFSLFGFITIVPAEYTKALDQLYRHADMRTGGSRTLANLAVERTNDFWVLFGIPRVFIRADVVEFTSGPPVPGFSVTGSSPTTQPAPESSP